MGPVLHPDLAGRPGGASFDGPAIFYEHFYLAIQAAEAAQGVAMASIHMVGNALACGRLVAPHGFLPDGTRYLAIWPAGSADPRREAVLGWLRDQFRLPSTCPS